MIKYEGNGDTNGNWCTRNIIHDISQNNGRNMDNEKYLQNIIHRILAMVAVQISSTLDSLGHSLNQLDTEISEKCSRFFIREN